MESLSVATNWCCSHQNLIDHQTITIFSTEYLVEQWLILWIFLHMCQCTRFKQRNFRCNNAVFLQYLVKVLLDPDCR